MALETSTYINGLVATNPTSTDNVGDGDNHIRLLKSTIKATFPNVTGAVTATQSSINSGVSLANTATNANTASSIVKRDGSGNFSAGTISANLSGNVTGNVTGNLTGNVTGHVTGTSGSTTGNAATATALATSRTISLSGDVTGSASFNGSANATISATVGNDSHSHSISYVTGLQSALDAKTTLADAKLAAHPVYSIYISVSSTNPASLFGGTWVSFGAGRVLVGINSSDSDFNQSQETGGAKTHTLTINEMPSHNHQTSSYSGNNGSQVISEPWEGNWGGGNRVSNTGGGQAHNNLQPYIVVYMWKRTA